MTDLIAEILSRLERLEDKPDLDDAIATGDNTVTVGQSTVAVTLPAIVPVVSGDFCQVLSRRGGNRVIIGPVFGVNRSTSYTPTLSVIAIGTGGSAANTAHYTIGQRLHLNGIIRFGTSGQTFPTAGNEGVSLPAGFEVHLPSASSQAPLGRAAYWNGSAAVMGEVVAVDGDTSLTFVTNTLGSLGAATPITWASGYEIRWYADVPYVRT